MENRNKRQEIIAAGVVVIVGVASVWPMVVKPDRVAKIGTDGVLIAWIMNSDRKNISGIVGRKIDNAGGLFNGNIIYPYKNVLAYSEMFYLSSLVSWIGTASGNNPGAASGVALVVGQVATMVIVYVWGKEMTGNRGAAAVGAVALGLARIRWEYQVHLQMWGMEWWLGAAYLWWKWLREGKRWQWIGAGIVWGLQFWESLLPVYFMAVVSVIMTWGVQTMMPAGRRIKMLATAALLAGIVGSPVLWAYKGVGSEFHYQRSIREAAHNGMSVEEVATKFGSGGLYVLAAAAGIIIIRHKKTGEVKWLAVVMAAGLILAWGPVVKWQGKTVKAGGRLPIPLPYAAAYYAVPGFGALRTPSRWIWISAWAAAGIVAVGISKSRGRTIGIGAAMVVAIAGGSGLAGYIDLPRAGEIPEVYKWLVKQPGQIIAELPMGQEDMEKWRMWYSVYHQKTSVNGFSGFTPPAAEKLEVEINNNCISPKSETELTRLGVKYVIVHEDQGNEERKKCEKWIAEKQDKIEWKDEKTVVIGL